MGEDAALKPDRFQSVKDFLSSPFLYILLWILGGIVISVSPDKTTQLILYVGLGVGVLVACGAYLIYLENLSRGSLEKRFARLNDEKVRLQNELEQKQLEIERQPRIAYYRLAQKTVRILNQNPGDARIYYYYECLNGDSALGKMRHALRYDARKQIEKTDVVILVNGKKLDTTIESFSECDISDTKHKIEQYITRIEVNPVPPIPKNTLFTYEYGMEAEAVYPKLQEEGGEEHSSHSVNHQTDLLRFRLFSPNGSEFSSFRIEVEDYNHVRDTEEEARCYAKSPPKRIHNGRELIWEIPNPRITYVYYLHFKLVKNTT